MKQPKYLTIYYSKMALLALSLGCYTNMQGMHAVEFPGLNTNTIEKMLAERAKVKRSNSGSMGSSMIGITAKSELPSTTDFIEDVKTDFLHREMYFGPYHSSSVWYNAKDMDEAWTDGLEIGVAVGAASVLAVGAVGVGIYEYRKHKQHKAAREEAAQHQDNNETLMASLATEEERNNDNRRALAQYQNRLNAEERALANEKNARRQENAALSTRLQTMQSAALATISDIDDVEEENEQLHQQIQRYQRELDVRAHQSVQVAQDFVAVRGRLSPALREADELRQEVEELKKINALMGSLIK